MSFLSIPNVKLVGLSACVPKTIENNKLIYAKWGGYDNFVSTTGIAHHRKCDKDTCTSDLCFAAAEQLIEDLSWNKEEIDAIIFVTQTPDYILPATSCVLQNKLGLSKDCYVLDISLGCSGWVYGLSTLAALMQNGSLKKALLLAGDTILKLCSPDDKSTYPLFGDAGTVTALEYKEGEDGLKFNFNTDGSGYEAILVKDGGYRNPVSADSFEMKNYGEGLNRNSLQIGMDGMSVFSFGISKAPKSVNGLLEKFAIDKDCVDYYIFHQANKMMNERIRTKLKLTQEQVPYCMDDFGNTSCASIPLTMVTRMKDDLETKKLHNIGCGFGVGLSWGSVYFETDKIKVSNLIEI